MDDRNGERQPLITPKHDTYWTRWYVVMMVALTNFLNIFLKVYWGPIAQSAKIVYEWSDNTIFVLINLGTAAAFLSALAGCYLVDRKGIRFATLVCCVLMVICTTSKIVTMDSYTATILIGFGQLFNGLGMSVTGAIPPAVSEVWFPLKERATATAIAALAGGLGGASTFIIGPLVVSMPAMRPVMWQLGLMYGLSIGSIFAWASVLDIIVNTYGVSQVEAGWLGFYGGVGGVFGGLVLGRIADIFKRRLKFLLIGDCILVALCYGLFTLQCDGKLPRSRDLFYIAAVGGLLLATSTIPLFIELTCEASYPIAAGLTSGFLSMIINFASVVSLLLNLIPYIGTAWMNWWVTVTYLSLVPLFLILKVTYHRVDTDSGSLRQPFNIN